MWKAIIAGMMVVGITLSGLLGACGGEIPVPATEISTEAIPPEETVVITGDRVYIPVGDIDFITNTAEGSPDDVMPAPGLGPQYRANIQQQGVQNPWPPVPITTINLAVNEGTGVLSYRSEAQAALGDTKYNIIKAFPGEQVDSGRLYSVGAPDWLTLVHGQAYAGSGMMWGPVLAMEIGPEAPYGDYTLVLGIEINGTDYGTFPVTLTVIE